MFAECGVQEAMRPAVFVSVRDGQFVAEPVVLQKAADVPKAATPERTVIKTSRMLVMVGS